MTFPLAPPQLSLLSERVARHLGLHFPPERWPDLERGLRAAAEDGRLATENYLEDLLAGRQMESFARHVTIGETYFFREIRSLQILEQRILPDYLATHPGKPFKIWSAGCATGEEPYSVAIMLGKLLARLPERSIEILATDVNTRSLRKAAEGVYTHWSFRGTPSWVQRTCFDATEDGRWTIAPAIRKRVHFEALNLMDDRYPPPANSLDVIFCRNVLMYFTPEGRRKVIQQFHRCLAADGWLVVGATETSQELFSDFERISFGDVTLYRKSPQPVPATVMVALDYSDRPIIPPEAAKAEPPAAAYPQALTLYEQARIHANQGSLTEALTWCDRAIAADRMAARAHYLRAAILQEQGELPEAIVSLKQAVYAEPECVMSHFALGNLAWRQGKLQQSEKDFETVLRLLARYQPEDIVPESDGLPAATLRDMVARKRLHREQA